VVTAIGAPGLYFHDLRHTGNQLVADTGAGLRDLMARMGHDSARGNVNAYPMRATGVKRAWSFNPGDLRGVAGVGA
jgi:integrase